jgi:putative tricarboxylic transport membrane protein
MLLSRGDPAVFIERPISATLLALAVFCIVAVSMPTARAQSEEAFRE